MKDKILIGVLLAIIAIGTVVGILDFLVWSQPNPEIQSLLFGLALGVIYAAFTPGIWLIWKYVYNGILLHFPILSALVILRAFVSLLVWILAAWGLMGTIAVGLLNGDIKFIIIGILIVIAQIAFRIYRIKNPEKTDIEVNGEKV